MARQPHKLSQVPLFARMSHPALDRLAAVSRIRTYPAGQVLWHHGDPGVELLILEQGRLRASRISPDAGEAIVTMIEPVSAVGELALLDGGPHDVTMIAQRDVIVRLIPRQAFLNALHDEPGMAGQLIKHLAGLVRDGHERHELAVGHDVGGRLLIWLYERARVHGQAQPDGCLRVTLDRSQAELAAELWTTRSTLNRALHQLEACGVIRIVGDTLFLARNHAALP
jgi:CRP/FNR family transcriptional regulator